MARRLWPLALLLAACGPTPHPVPPTTAPTAPTVAPTVQAVTAGCHSRPTALGPLYVLPSQACTPGAVNPDVTQADPATTICKTGWTATVRPPLTYTGKVKAEEIGGRGGLVAYNGVTYTVHGYALTDRNPADYELDHLIPLELGGAPADPRNLWPEPNYPGGPHPTKYDRNPKDPVEFALRNAVCAGRLTLAAAQQEIVSDWTTAKP